MDSLHARFQVQGMVFLTKTDPEDTILGMVHTTGSGYAYLSMRKWVPDRECRYFEAFGVTERLRGA